jgi:arabinan endo-1,5-alpha-L-arabinosidase
MELTALLAEIGTRGVHDPTIMPDPRGYTMFSTDTMIDGQPTQGIQRRYSPDLIHWHYQDQALSGVPADAKDWNQAQGLWAPEVVSGRNEYRLYYAASTFGSQRSAIGLATAADLDAPFIPQGLVLTTEGGQDQRNALDPNVIQDGKRQWLCYGSFFAGIYLAELDPATGMLKKPDDPGVRIAARPRALNNGSIEGPFIYHSPLTGEYYLFVSYDSLAYSYNIRVGRAKQITGPYRDFQGHNLIADDPLTADQVGTKILGSRHFAGESAQLLAPGHCSVLDVGPKQYLVYHNRAVAGGPSFGLVSQLHWTVDGWPVVSPEPVYGAACSISVAQQSVVGDWDIVSLTASTDPIESQRVTLTAADVEQVGPEQFVLVGVGHVNVWQEYDWAIDQPRVVFSGITPQGWGVLGKKAG